MGKGRLGAGLGGVILIVSETSADEEEFVRARSVVVVGERYTRNSSSMGKEGALECGRTSPPRTTDEYLSTCSR